MLRIISEKDKVKLEKIDVVILCGGEGIRLREVINDRPKTMAEINNRPFLDILIDYISSYGCRRFILCVGYMAEFIKRYYKEKSDSYEILFSEENKLLGTGGAVKNAEKIIQSNPFLAMNGDSFCSVDLSQFLDFHFKKGALLSMVVVNAENPSDYGIVAMDGTHRIIQFKEKMCEEKAYVNAGVYLFEKDIFTLIPPYTKYSLEDDLFPKLAGREFYGYITKEKLIDIGIPKRYEQAKRFFVK